MSHFCDGCRLSHITRDPCTWLREESGRCTRCTHGASCHPSRNEMDLARMRILRSELALLEHGHRVAFNCDECGAAVAACDFGLDEPCDGAAYKWVSTKKGEAYFCESHGQVPDWLEDWGVIDCWGAYDPGEDCSGCGAWGG